ncbi:MAG: glycosyltransferase [Candidatus Omnitrophica bacterium]|nr:glycosyltransferase [Candidatus Omnitrophota bacterium]MBI2173925.1 glycosyltransferase [Candidatus Omnitrophota bacterium]MBI3010762.1 glycosyltransferase [Candidatus Omnitrophota bacterium]
MSAVQDSLQEIASHEETWKEVSSERRRYPRLEHKTAIVGTVGPWYRRRKLKGMLVNLSATGIALRFPRTACLVPGARLRVQLEVPPPPVPLGSESHGGRCFVSGWIMWSRLSSAEDLLCGIRLSKQIQESLQMQGWAWARAVLLGIAGLLLAMILFLKTYNIRWFWYEPWFNLYSLVVAGYILSRTLLALFYRPPKDCGFLPTVSVVIAVKNEESHIAETIEHCFQSRYPADRMEVILVDDGSTDGTWAAVRKLLSRFPNLRTFQFTTNRGKRHAMALGAEQACGEILVYVDSDSYLDPDGIYQLVQGFTDPKIGAIAGHVEVVVEESNPISKMESVRYFISHRVMKAAESVFGCVTCCSGAFSAYRRSAAMAVLPRWLNQTFLGTQSTFGDDRSLTNFILRDHRVVFCERARCSTYVPATWGKYFRQQLRWKKSWSRETLVASRIMYRKHPLAAIPYYVGVILTLFAPLMVIRNVIVLPLFYSMNCLSYLVGLLLVYLFFCCIYVYFTRSRFWYYGLIFAGLYIGVLSWQNYYAMATVSKTHWGTR